MADILIVDDEQPIRESIEMFMVEKGHRVFTAATAKSGYEAVQKCSPDVMILDIRLPDGNGLDLLKQMQISPNTPKVIMITAFHDMETTIEAMKRGAYDYIHKPIDADELERAVDGAIYHITADRETPFPKGMEGKTKSGVIIGNSKEMKEIFKMIGILCRNRATALIQGETGTGKELIARTIHKNCLFCDEPFITFDCSSVVENLLESELFGHEKGAFTGAVQAKMGKIELAGAGTLFLDEIGELPLNLQSKFLGFLERGEYMRVGGNKPFKSRCRIIAATNQNLEWMVEANRFRSDLYYRLKVVTIQVPALRRRLSDIPDLADHFLQKAAAETGEPVLKLQAGCNQLLQGHPWTGNVRELKNVILAAAVQARGNVILKEDLEQILQGNTNQLPGANASMALSDMEKRHILNTLFKVNWNRTHAARLLKISLPTLRKKIKKYHIAHAADGESND